MARRHAGPSGMPYMGGGHFTPGFWRPDRSSGKIAIPEGPQAPIERPDGDRLAGGRERDPRTAANIAAHEAALAPRRYRPQA